MELCAFLKTAAVFGVILSVVSTPVHASCGAGVEADMVFVLDASGSVGASNFQTMLQFVQDLIDGFDIGANAVRIGVQKYSSGTNTEFNLNTDYVKSSIKTRVANIYYTTGGTNTGGALEYLRTSMFTSGNGDRSGVPNIGVVITDGRSNSATLTASEAANARNAGITLFAIGIGSNIPETELNAIATDPDSDHVYMVSGFSALSSIMSSFQAQACPAVNGNWGSWGSYGSCTLTCGGGTMTRYRSCDNPSPSNGGSYCSGNDYDSASCNTHNCPIDGGFTTWTAWGTCSVTCNVGTHDRSRSCTNPSPAYGGAQCSGHTSETQTCDVGPSVDGCNYVGASCTSCDPGYSFSGSDCNWCKTNFTGCYCQNCQADHIGYNSDCGVLCYNGQPDVVGGRICVCYADTTLGHWAGSACDYCKTGWMSPLCTTCDTDYVGPYHCTIRCRWGQGYHVYKEDGNWGSRALTPAFDCVVDNNDGTYTAYFGYANSNNHNLYISAGPNSYLTGTTGTLPTQYKPGTYNYVFSTAAFTIGSSVSWTLGYTKSNTVFTVTVPSNPTFCPNTPTSTLPTGAIEVVDPGHCHCMPGYYGSECQSVCPGGVGSPCYNHGTCDQVTGVCTCDPHWSTGSSCQSCDTGWSGGDCTVAVPPSSPHTTPSSTYVAKAFADGGFITFDGAMYTFNGIGEYKLWSSRSGMTGEVEVYGRKALTSSNSVATSLDAVAVVSEGNKLEIYAGALEDSPDGTAYLSTEDHKIYIGTSAGQLTSHVSYRRVTSDHYQVYMSPRYTINVYVRGRTLDVTIESDSYSCYDTYGLLSGCDNSASNDIRAASGTVYSGSTLTTQTIHENFAPSYLINPGGANCAGGAQLDMVFVLDSSGSVGSSNFQVMKQFVYEVVNDFDIGADEVRVGVFKYASYAGITEFNLNYYNDKNGMLNLINNIVYQSGGTNTGGALEYLRTTMFTTGNGDRSNVPNVGIVMTDGTSNDYTLTANMAASARSAGITLFSIGIGSGIPLGELNEIATDPDADHVFQVSDFASLTAIKNTLQSQACAAAASSIFTYAHYPYPYLAGGHLCFDRTYMVSSAVATFSNDDVTIEVKMKTNTAHKGCGVIFSYQMTDVFTVLACSTYLQVYQQSIGTVTVSTISFTSETWYHLAFVWTKSSENLRVLRYDADLNEQYTDVSLTSLNFNPFQPGGTFVLGRYNSLSGNPENLHWEFIGCLDDLRIWDTGLSNSDVSTRAWTYVTKDTASLSSIWRFDEGEGESTLDQMSDTTFQMETDLPWAKPQWNKTNYDLDALTYTTYSLEYNTTGSYDRDFDLKSSLETFCNNVIYGGSLSGCSSLGAGQHEFFYLHCIYSGLAHRSDSKTMETVLAFADYCQAISGSSGLSQNLCNNFTGRSFPHYSGVSCTTLCQSGTMQPSGTCVCAAGFRGSQCDTTCPSTVHGVCNGNGLCDPANGQCTCNDRAVSGSDCVTCKTGWSGVDCRFSTMSQRHNGSYYMCAGYEGGQFITLDGLVYSAPKAGEFKMLIVSGLELYIRQVSCKVDQFCITGIWAVLGGSNVAIRAPMSSSGGAYVEVNGSPVQLDATMSLATDVSVELYSPDRYLLHYRNRYDVFIRVYDYMLEIQALVTSWACNTDTGLCGSCNNSPNDDLKDAGGNNVDYTTSTTQDVADNVLPVHEVSSTTTTYFIYQTTYTEPSASNGGGYAMALNRTALESQYLDVFTHDIVTLDFQVKPSTTDEGTVVGFTSDEIVAVNASGTYKLVVNGTTYDSGISVTANEWNHVTMTYFKNNGTVEFYVDTETSDSTKGSVTISETIFNSPGVITVGGQSPRPGESLSTVPSPTFEGEFDNLRVWNRTFDVTQAKQLNYTNVNSTSFSGLVTQWTFSEGQGTTSTDDVGGLLMNVPRQDTAEWQLSGPTMDVIDGMTQQQAATDVIVLEQMTQTSSTLLTSISAAETFCQDLIYNSQVHSSCSGSLGTNVAVFFYDKCRTANIYVSDSRYYSVQSLVDYALHCKVLTNPATDPMISVCQAHSLVVSGNICTESSTCRFGTLDSVTSSCTCDSGYWGTECSQVCPGGASTPCNNQGTCNTDTGACVCAGNFAGIACASCASGWSGSNCNVMTPNPSDPWLTSQERMCSFSVAGSVMAFGGKKFSFTTAGDFYFIKRNPGVPGSTGVQARLLQCLSGQVCLSGAAFYNDVDDLTVEVDPINNGLQVSLNGAAQAANIGLLSSSSFTFQYLSAFSIQVNDTNGMDAVVGLIDSRLNLIVKAHSSQLGLNESLCGDGTVDPSDTTVPGSETSVSTVDVVFNTTTSTTTTTYTTTTVIPSGASFGTAGGSMFLNQTFLSSDPTSGLFLPTSPGTVEMFIRPYQSQGVLYSYGYDSTFSIFLNDTLQVMVGSTVYDTGFQVTQGQWSEVAVAWNPDLDLMTVYHVNDGSTMDYKRFTVTNMSCFEDGGVMTVGKWRQPNSNANHPPTEVTYLGEVDEVRLWSQDLSHSDILSGFQQPVDTSDPTLVGRWTFDEGQGTTVNDFRGTHLYVTDHSQAGTTPQWMLSDAPVYNPTTTTTVTTGGSSTVNQTSSFLTEAQSVCSSAVGSFTSGNCVGLSADVSAFYLAACQDVVIASGNLTKAAEVVATMVALCNVGASNPSTVADYWCNDYAGNYLLGTGLSCTDVCMFPNTTRSTRTSCVCADGYWGTNCSSMCPGGPSSPCNSHGTCDPSSGSCTCQVNWRGDTGCGSCTAGWTGADCSVSFLSTTTKAICSASSMGRFTTFDGSSVQHTNLGAYTLYDEPAGPSVVVEQAPCSKMTACVYRVILTYSADILVFDLTSPNVGIKVVNNGAEIFVHSETALANGLLFSRQTLTQFTVRSSNDDFKLEVRVREAYLAVDMLVDKTRCAANTGVCGPCQTQNTTGCSINDATCLIQQLGVMNASQAGINVTVTETSVYIDTQRINVTATELGYSTSGSASSYTSATSQTETAAGYGLDLDGEGASADALPASTVDTTKNITLEAVIHVDNAEGTVLSYADQYTFSINLNQGVFEVQCDSQVLSTGISATMGNWSHVSVVYDQTTGRTMFNYIDTDEIPQYKLLTLTTSCFPDQGTLSVGQWQLSKANTGSIPSGSFDGQVDRVALWNRRFGPADLLNHWKQDFDPTGEPDLAAYWKFNEGQGDTAYDAVQGVRMSLPSTSVWSLSQAPIDDSTATQQHVTGAASVLSAHEQMAVNNCTSLFYSGDINTNCGLLTDRANYYYVSCVNDVTQARDADYAMDSVLQFATECQTTLGLGSWPAQGLCNHFPSRSFPTYFGASCTLRCDFGTKVVGADLCKCDSGYWGTNCDNVCPGNGVECFGHGTCQQASGACACNLQWQGDSSCSTCTSGWTGSDCSIMAPSSAGVRPPTMCTVDRGGFLLTYDLYGVTLDQPSTYTILSMDNFQVQVTQVTCSSGLCVQGMGINYHDRNLVVSLDAASLLDLHVDGVEQGRGVAQSLDPTSVSNCTLTVTWTKDTSLVVELAPISFRLLVNAVGSSLSVILKDVAQEACCDTRMTGLCGSCGTCSTNFTDTCQLSSISPAPAPATPSAPACNVSFNSTLGQTALMQLVTCAQVSSTNNMFSSLLSYDSLGIAKGFYESKQGSGEGICFDKSSALVKDFKLLTTDYVTLEFLVKSCNTSDCYGTLISYGKDQTFSIRHSSEVAITWGSSIWRTNFRLEDKAWNQISLVFDKTTYEMDLYYFDSNGMAGRYYLQLSENVLPNDGFLGVGRWQPSPHVNDMQHGAEIFKGCIDQLRFWNRTFDNIQIQNHWNKTYDGTEDYLISLWLFDNNRNGYTYDKIHDVQMTVPLVPFPPGEIDYSDAPIPYTDLRRSFPFPITFSFLGRKKRSLTSEVPLTDIIATCEYIFSTSDLASACTGVGSQMTEKYFFDCLSDMYYGEDLSDALTSTLAYADYCEVTLGLSSWPARTLCNYFPFSAGFPNWIGDNCDVACVSGSRHPNDNNTCLCDYGYYGSNCSSLCPGGTENTCSGYGTCDVTTGVCPCPVSRRGSADCSSCQSGWEGTDCVITSSSSSIATPVAKVSDLGHILNLDGVGFGFQGIGEYHLLQLRPNIVLEGKFIMCQQNFSCLSFVGMRVGSNGHGYAEITVQAPYLTTSEPPVYVNGALNTVRKVAYFTYFEIRRTSLHEVILDVYNTVQVTIRSRKRLLDLTVTVPTANVPATVGLLAGGGSTSWTDKEDYIEDYSRIDSLMSLCMTTVSTQSPRSSQYSGTLSLPTSSVLSAPSSGQSLDLTAYFARYPVDVCDSVFYYPDTDYSSQEGDGYTLKFDSTALYSQFDTAALMSSNLSIEVVVKVDSTGQGGALLSFATTELFMIFIDSSYYLQIFYNNAWYAPSPSLLMETDVWNKVLFVYESAVGTVDLYRFDQSNLVKRGILTLPTGIFDTAGRLAIGQGLPPQDGQYYSAITSFKGEVDNLRLWKIIVEPTMVVDVSDLGMSLTDYTIRAAWTFDEAEGDNAYDLIQGAVLALPVDPWKPPVWRASDKTNTRQVTTSPLVFYFVNKTLETAAESECSQLISDVGALAACSGLSAGTKSFYLMQCIQQVAGSSDLNAAYLAMHDLGDVCYNHLNTGSWPLSAYCTGNWTRRGTDCLGSCVFGDWDGSTCTCYDGFSGSDCSSACPTANNQYCNGHGTCSSGSCVCDHNWQGSTCSSCASGWTGSECTVHFGTRLTSNPRTGFVSATGDVVTFDGASFTFSGVTGVYKVLEDPSDGMYVQAHFVYCEFGTCVDAVGVRMSNIKVTVYAPPRAYALPKVNIGGSEISITGTVYTINSYFKIYVMSRSSLKIAISSPYQCDVTVTAAGKFLQIGAYVRSYMCSSSTGLMGECDSSNSNDLYYNPGSYSQATLMSQLSSVYEVTFSSSVFSYDSAEFNGVTKNTKAGFAIDYSTTTLQSPQKLAYVLSTNQSYTLSFSYRPRNTIGAILTYSRNDSFVILNSNPISIQIGSTTHTTSASSALNSWNQIVLMVDRANNEVEFFHYEGGQRSYEKLSLGSHEFLEPDGWLTFGQLQVSIDESPYNLWNGANMYEGDISDVLVLNGILPHVIVAQAFQLHTGLLDFASSEVLYSFRLKEGTSYIVEDVTGTNDLHFAYAPWQTTPWELSDQAVSELSAREEDQWNMAVDYVKLSRESTANSLCSGFFQHASITSTCSSVDTDFRNQLEAACVDSYEAIGQPEAVVFSMLAFTDLCGYIATPDVSATTLCDAQFLSLPWVELRCTGCQHGYKIADGTCQCYPGYSGTMCNATCPGGVDTPCNNRGTCNKDETCTCNINWTGFACTSCSSDWTGTDCNTQVGDYISGPYTTAVAQIRSQRWVTTFDGNTFYLNTDDTYLLLRVHNTNFYVYGRQTTCGTDPKTFTCFDAFMIRHGSSYYFADWTNQDEHALTLKTLTGDVTVLTKRTFGTLSISRSSLNSFQFLESTAGLLMDITLYDHGPHITMQLLRKTDLVNLTLSGLLASCDTQFAAQATTCSGVTMCHPTISTTYIGNCQTTVSSSSFSTLASNAVSTEKTTFNSLAGAVPSHSVTEYMLYMNRTGLITADNLTISAVAATSFEIVYNPEAHGGVVFSYGDVATHVALVDNDTSLNIVYMNKVVPLGQTSVLMDWNQVTLVWFPVDQQLELYYVNNVGEVHMVRAQLDSGAFQSGRRATLGQMLPSANLSTNDHLNSFVGYMGELRIYNRPHNPTVVTQNTFIDVTENTPDLQHAWNFDVNEGDYFIDLKYSVHMVATNVSETPIWGAAGYTLTVKDGATSFWVTLPRSDPFETLARQKCDGWFTNATLLSNCQLGNPFIDTYKEQCYEDQVARRNHSEGMKSVLQFAEFCRRLEIHGGSPSLSHDTLVHNASDLCQEFPEATFQGYWFTGCSTRCLFGRMVQGECHCTDPYWGPECDQDCPVSNHDNTAVCDSHGHCRKTDGVCVCQSRWTGVVYNYSDYTTGYIDSNADYACTVCSVGWYGTDCSTALLERAVNGSDGYALISSSVIITVDGASMELSKTGGYRLLTSTNITVDGYFKQCQGRHDCRALQEVSVTFNADLLSLSVNEYGTMAVHKLVNETDVYYEATSPVLDKSGDMLVLCSSALMCRITVEYALVVAVQVFEGEMFAGFIVSENLTNVGVGGLLGNFDGDWLNEFYTGGYSDNFYITNYLSANTKAQEAETYHTVTSPSTILNNTDLSSVVSAAGGYLLKGNSTAMTVVYDPLNLTATHEFTIEMWVYIEEASSETYDLFTFTSEVGDTTLSVENGQLKLEWQRNYTSHVTVSTKTWSRVVMTWRSSDGLVYLYRLESGGAAMMDMEWNFPFGQNLTFFSLTFGGSLSNAMSMDYARVWSIVRGMTDLQADLSTYDTAMHHGVEFLALFDEGFGSETHARIVQNNTVLVVQGTVTNAQWASAAIPTTVITYPADLPAIVNDTEAVLACHEEFEKGFTEYCPDFGSIKQLLMELCISDVIRFNDTKMVSMALTAFAFYCQAVTQQGECIYKGYLDFCPTSHSSNLLPLILGITLGLAGCCCCCILLGLLRKKLFGDEAAQQPKKPEGPENGQQQQPKKPGGFEEKEFSGADLPPDAKPPVPPPSTNMYNYLSKMDGIDADDQELFTKYNRSPSVNSIALSLQSYGIGDGATSPTMPTSPSRASLGQISEEPPMNPITPVQSPRP